MLPSRRDPRWRNLVLQPEAYTYDFLALKILMQRIVRLGAPDVEAAVDEIYSVFHKHERLMAKDIQVIFG